MIKTEIYCIQNTFNKVLRFTQNENETRFSVMDIARVYRKLLKVLIFNLKLKIWMERLVLGHFRPIFEYN